MSSKYDTDDYELVIELNWKRKSPIEKCEECNGRGEWDDAEFGDIGFNKFFCDACEGTGETLIKPPEISQSLKDEVHTLWLNHNDEGTITCKECNGTGDYEDPATRFETTIECPFCYGMGEI